MCVSALLYIIVWRSFEKNGIPSILVSSNPMLLTSLMQMWQQVIVYPTKPLIFLYLTSLAVHLFSSSTPQCCVIAPAWLRWSRWRCCSQQSRSTTLFDVLGRHLSTLVLVSSTVFVFGKRHVRRHLWMSLKNSRWDVFDNSCGESLKCLVHQWNCTLFVKAASNR